MKNLKNYYNHKFCNKTKSPNRFIYKIDKNKFSTNTAEQIKLKLKTKKFIKNDKPIKKSHENYNYDILSSYFPTELSNAGLPTSILVVAAILKRRMRYEKRLKQYEKIKEGLSQYTNTER